MRTKHLISLLIVLFCSCTQPENLELLSTEGCVSEDNAVSVSEALTNLDNELRSIYGPDTRSAANLRKVKTVNRLDFNGTRASNGDAGCPLYIVEFEDGKGSAVLSADNRVEPVLAILGNSVLTESDFTSTNSEDIKPYVASLIRQYANNILKAGDFEFRPVEPGGGIDTVYHYIRKPLIKTKWHQYSPYNDLCFIPSFYDIPVRAGCAAIAVSQLVKFHKYPAIINSQSFDWDLLSQYDYGSYITDEATDEVARFVYNIGRTIGIDYAKGEYTAKNPEISNALKILGYKNVSIKSYSDSYPYTSIYIHGKPVLITGFPYEGEGHAWLLDGWNEYKIKGLKMLIDGTSEIVYTTTTKVHCNYGWGGECDGYYTSGIFNTTSALSSGDIDSKIGDRTGTNGNYNTNLGVFTHDLP